MSGSSLWDHDSYCDALSGEIARFAAAVRDADPATPVPTCPGWRVAKLVKHVGILHRWAERMVRDRTTERLDPRQLDVGLPADESGYAEWLAAGAAPLVAALRDAGPYGPVWAWGADQRAGFWSRRLLHETTIHRADVELTLGREPAIDTSVAVDAIDEFLDNLPYAPRFTANVAELPGDGESLHFHSTDADGEWMILLGPEGFTWQHGHGKASSAVRGPAADLMLLVYGRRRPEDARFQRFGDDAVLDRWRASTVI